MRACRQEPAEKGPEERQGALAEKVTPLRQNYCTGQEPVVPKKARAKPAARTTRQPKRATPFRSAFSRIPSGLQPFAIVAICPRLLRHLGRSYRTDPSRPSEGDHTPLRMLPSESSLRVALHAARPLRCCS